MQTQQLAEDLKTEAYRLGFHLVGITTAQPLSSFHRYQKWLDAGYHGEMDYLASEAAVQRRADPQEVLPGCRSILVLGVRYPPPLPGAHGDPLSGSIAAYAQNQDYHEALKPRLRALVGFIETRIGEPVPNRWYIDTGPLLERELGQRAGLGWIGKNGMLIHPRQGSYFLLAEILLGIELPPDAPFSADRCGSCTRCIQACPTGCILDDCTLDARRCLSYLTIELKGDIPAELRSFTGNWIFGCDICQQVCPWNRHPAPAAIDPAFTPRAELSQPDLISQLSLTPQQFNACFKGSPVKRSKRRGYLRNAAVAQGNSGSTAAVPALAECMQKEAEALVRCHAAWALGRLGGRQARVALNEALSNEEDQSVRAEIQTALEYIEGKSSAEENNFPFI
jgi:epoxyqueuosine reductase